MRLLYSPSGYFQGKTVSFSMEHKNRQRCTFHNISPLFLFYTLVVICSLKISFSVFANSSQIFLSVLNDLAKREENTHFVFRNDFETSFWLKQSTNQRLASAYQEVSRHKKHCQDLNGTNIKPQFTCQNLNCKKYDHEVSHHKKSVKTNILSTEWSDQT